jgi:hypothetical protein
VKKISVVWVAAAMCWCSLDRGFAAPGVGSTHVPAVRSERATLSALPAPAQAQISAALGRGQSRYHAVPQGSHLRLENPSHGLTADFAATGVQVRAGEATWGLALRGYGYGDPLAGTARAVPRAIANRVEYLRDGFTEWYVNGPLGLEQGFTLTRAPGERTGAPLTLSFGLSGNLTASADGNGKDLVLTRSNGSPALKYRGLMAHDASGRELRSWLEVDGRRLSLRVDDTDARYPVVVDPFIEQAQLKASDPSTGDQFGFVAVDGDTIVVGAPFDDVGSNIDQGSAYVFVKPAGGWSGLLPEQARLFALDGAAGDTFGLSVAISGDTIVVGARGDDISTRTDQGSAYVFVKPAEGWNGTLNQSAKLTAVAGINDWFGDRVAIDGDTIVVGARLDDVGGGCILCDPLVNRGSAYVFVKPATGWAGDRGPSATLNPADPFFGPEFGSSVAIDGDTIAVGAWRTNGDRGVAYVFMRPTTGWGGSRNPNATLTASDPAGSDLFGVSISVSGDTIAVGAYRDDTGTTTNHGSAYVFVRPAGGWTGTADENAKLTASDAATNDEFGNPVAVSGNTIVVGARLDNVSSNVDQGSAYVFLRPTGGWSGPRTEDDKLTASDGSAADGFGGSVAMGGNTLVIGASLDDTGGLLEHGSAYVFLRDDPATLTLSPSEFTNPIDTDHTVTAAVIRTSGQPAAGEIVRFSVSGAVTTTGTCTTDATGQCPFTYHGPATPGSDTILAYADTNQNGTEDAGEPRGSAAKTWVDTDQDDDGIGDLDDNCVADANPEQTDTDSDGQGDACDPDDDNDSVADADDAFPLDAAEWIDTDGDGTGNNADADDDNDGVPDAADAFPLDAAESVDTDGDGTGNNADTDDDNDGVPDGSDAFPLDAAESVDTDRDGIGNNADADDDNDGVPDGNDAFPLDPAESADNDRDGIGNNADPDDDNDGVVDAADAFPFDPRESADNDGDGVGNNADPDDDNDGIADANETGTNPFSPDTDADGVADGPIDPDGAGPLRAGPDNCPTAANADQTDTDGDGSGDVCDADDDNDEVIDALDNCALMPNPDQTDTDGDGTGDICDPTPGSTAGKISGGGFITPAKHNFAFQAQYREGMLVPEGHVNYEDRAAGIKLRATRLTSLQIYGAHAVVVGEAIIDGVDVRFQLEVDDLGEPGDGDTFTIQWLGYGKSGVLEGGNIQVRAR